MQNEGLHCEIKEKTEMLETQKEKNEFLEKENKQLLKKVDELAHQNAVVIKTKESEIEKLRREVELLRSQVSSLTSSTVSVLTLDSEAARLEFPEQDKKESENIFDQI